MPDWLLASPTAIKFSYWLVTCVSTEKPLNFYDGLLCSPTYIYNHKTQRAEDNMLYIGKTNQCRGPVFKLAPL